jgi:hypothetical protein
MWKTDSNTNTSIILHTHTHTHTHTHMQNMFPKVGLFKETEEEKNDRE